MEETLRVLVVLGLVLILVLLRLDSRRFGVAEYHVPDDDGEMPPLLPRLAWYGAGIILIVAVYVVHPGAVESLGLQPGDRAAALLMGLGAGSIGIAQAIAIAYARLGAVRPPELRAYPMGVVNALGTAFVDEATFRGIVLGLVLSTGVEPLVAVTIQALAYVLATRVGRSGGDWYLVALDLAIGLVGGWLTVVTGGIAAAVIADAVTRLAVLVATGSADAGTSTVPYEEETETPLGWELMDEDGAEAPYDDADAWAPTAGVSIAGTAGTSPAQGSAEPGGPPAPIVTAHRPIAVAAATPPAGGAGLGAPPVDDELDDSDASLP